MENNASQDRQGDRAGMNQSVIFSQDAYSQDCTRDTLGQAWLSRGLQEMNERLAGVNIQDILRAHWRRDDARVLEIGCGEGRLLMELRRDFRNIEIFGLNKQPWPAMTGSESLKDAARYFALFDEADLEHITYPKIFFADAAQLPFESEFFDLIVSQACFHFVEEKVVAIEEIVRALRPGGAAHIHLDSVPFPLSDDCKLPTPRLVIFRQGEVVSIETLLNEKGQGTISAALKVTHDEHGRQRILLSIQKLAPGTIALQLKKVDSLAPTFYDGCGELQYGTRTVYIPAGEAGTGHGDVPGR